VQNLSLVDERESVCVPGITNYVQNLCLAVCSVGRRESHFAGVTCDDVAALQSSSSSSWWWW
jgi:hypothetical protein